MSDPYDFQIGDLKFRAAISDKFPYQRGTAQFRKEQFDSAPTVGDQSLSGWWTRGQMSFHKGAGVTYYELLDGDEILNRFRDSESVFAWRPGQVTLHGELESKALGALASVKDAVKVTSLASGDRILMLHTDGDLTSFDFTGTWSAGTFTNVPTSTGAAAAAITVGWNRAWVAVENRIEIWSVGDPTSLVLWTQTDGRELVGVWYLKGRLWVVDNYGSWFMLDAETGGSFTVATDEQFSILGIGWLLSSNALWSMTETPDAVLIAAFGNIYRVTLDESSGVPVLGAPTIVAQFPAGEDVCTIEYHVGHVAMATTQGARFGQLGGNGEIIYGPLVIEGNLASTVRIAKQGTRVFMTGISNLSGGVFGFDLGTMVSELAPAWAREYEIDDGAFAGTFSLGSGLVIWSSDLTDIHLTALNAVTRQPSGSISTGFHRFGTLELKHFAQVIVRVNGAGGTVAVYQVNADETENLLGTLTLPDQTMGEFKMIGDSPHERVGLKFVLTRDATDPGVSPELLGYQLKALPSPMRQRLIKVPVVAADIIRGRHGVDRGKRGAAYENWMRLEAMEEDDALVTFKDLRTGETGDVYIESVELQTDTPARSGETGFGGIGYITLRKVSSA